MNSGTLVKSNDGKYGLVYSHGENLPIVYFADMTISKLTNDFYKVDWDLKPMVEVPAPGVTNPKIAYARLVVNHQYTKSWIIPKGTIGWVVRDDDGDLVFIPKGNYIKVKCVHKCVKLKNDEYSRLAIEWKGE